MRGVGLAILAGLLLATGGCSVESGNKAGARDTARDENAEIAKVRATVQGLTAADVAGDVARVVSYYLDDAILLPPGAPEIWGKEKIREHYRKLFEENRMTVSAHSVEILLEKNWAVDRGWTKGILTPKKDGAAKEFDNKYVMLLKRDANGDWKVARLIWN